MTKHCVLSFCWILVMMCVIPPTVSAQETVYEGIHLTRATKRSAAPYYFYSGVGPLDFEGQDPEVKAKKVMLAACPQGQPKLWGAKTDDRVLLVVIFTCGQIIPGTK